MTMQRLQVLNVSLLTVQMLELLNVSLLAVQQEPTCNRPVVKTNSVMQQAGIVFSWIF